MSSTAAPSVVGKGGAGGGTGRPQSRSYGSMSSSTAALSGLGKAGMVEALAAHTVEGPAA